MCLFVSPGDRIIVLDDSNEEWWRVSLTFSSQKLLDVWIQCVPPLKMCTVSSGQDGGENRIFPCQLPHQSASVRESVQGDPLLRGQQRDGTNYAQEGSGNFPRLQITNLPVHLRPGQMFEVSPDPPLSLGFRLW